MLAFGEGSAGFYFGEVTRDGEAIRAFCTLIQSSGGMDKIEDFGRVETVGSTPSGRDVMLEVIENNISVDELLFRVSFICLCVFLLFPPSVHLSYKG